MRVARSQELSEERAHRIVNRICLVPRRKVQQRLVEVQDQQLLGRVQRINGDDSILKNAMRTSRRVENQEWGNKTSEIIVLRRPSRP